MGVTKLELVIANAAIMEESVATSRIDTVNPVDFEKDWRVNVSCHVSSYSVGKPLQYVESRISRNAFSKAKKVSKVRDTAE